MPTQMERAASKAMGKAKKVKAGVKGLKGIFQRLAEEHGELTAMLERVDRSSKVKVRAEFFPTIRKEFLSHERAELSELYPLLRKHAETRDIAEEHDRDAQELESMVEELNRLSFDSDEWGEKFSTFVEEVKEHAKDEENEYFPRAQEALGKDTAKELEQRYLSKKKSVMQTL